MVKVTANVLSVLLVIRLPHNLENNKKTPISQSHFPRCYYFVVVGLMCSWEETG